MPLEEEGRIRGAGKVSWTGRYAKDLLCRRPNLLPVLGEDYLSGLLVRSS